MSLRFFSNESYRQLICHALCHEHNATFWSYRNHKGWTFFLYHLNEFRMDSIVADVAEIFCTCLI